LPHKTLSIKVFVGDSSTEITPSMEIMEIDGKHGTAQAPQSK
jgi:hypothetical protein